MEITLGVMLWALRASKRKGNVPLHGMAEVGSQSCSALPRGHTSVATQN